VTVSFAEIAIGPQSGSVKSIPTEFWKRYFEKSGAVLEQFGKPALLQSLK
jgi:hypothetical protein